MEVEVKARVENLEEMKSKLEDMGAVFEEGISQKDRFFQERNWREHEHGPGHFILRIRTQGDRHFLTWKVFTDVRGAWGEHETGIENPEEMEKIILGCGFVQALELNKKRIRGRLGDFELCLDSVREIGYFLEVALDSEEKENPREKIRTFMKGLGVPEGSLDSRGYTEMVFEDMGVKFVGQR